MRELCRVERAWMMITIMKFDWMEDSRGMSSLLVQLFLEGLEIRECTFCYPASSLVLYVFGLPGLLVAPFRIALLVFLR
jgi:hypothetical protein